MTPLKQRFVTLYRGTLPSHSWLFIHRQSKGLEQGQGEALSLPSENNCRGGAGGPLRATEGRPAVGET